MKIVGCYAGHDANLCSVENGKLLQHSELERETRQKHFHVATGDNGQKYEAFLQGTLSGVHPDIVAVAGQFWGAPFKLGTLREIGDVRVRETEIAGRPAKAYMCSHHVAHMAYTAYLNGISDAACLSVDGGGDFTATAIGDLRGGRIGLVHVDPVNLGYMWANQAQFRFGNRFAAGTVMAAAALGDELGFQHLQQMTTQTMVRLSERAAELTGNTDTLVLSGGCVLNGIANTEIARRGIFKRVVLAPAIHDGGLSIGAALLAHVLETGEQPPAHTTAEISYAGRSFPTQDIAGWPVSPAEVAKAIAEGQLVGLYQGRSESGPRALGNRSILADPRTQDSHSRLNERIKKRESFRPYAPSVLFEHVGDWFDVWEGFESPYMLYIAPVYEDKAPEVPGIVHLDGTARIQTVKRQDNEYFYDVIAAFHELTGVPMVINTSFNRRGEPIVDSPGHAVDVFRGTDMDMLVVEGAAFHKRPAA